MKGIRFYADIAGTTWNSTDTNPAPETGKLNPRYITVAKLKLFSDLGVKVNCLALLLGKEHLSYDYKSQEALVGTFAHPNSDVSLGSVSFEYLQKCKRVPEKLARKLHPRLFTRLDC